MQKINFNYQSSAAFADSKPHYQILNGLRGIAALISPSFSLQQKNLKTMQTTHLLKQISFIKEIDRLKYIQRKTKLFNSNRHENDAEHSWHLAMMALVLAEHSDKPVDMLKVLKMDSRYRGN